MNINEANKYNMIQYLDKFLEYKASDSICAKERSQMSKSRYFHKVSENMAKLSLKPENWLFDFEENLPKHFLEFTESHRQTLVSFVQFDLEDFKDFAYFMNLLCRILSYYEENNELESPLAQIFLETYNYMKTVLLSEFYPEKAKEFDEKLQQNKELEINRPLCPKCGSSELTSMGINFYCKLCHQQTRKYLIQ